MKRYLGVIKEPMETDIMVQEREDAPMRRLDPRTGEHGGSRLANHSPDGFSWGYQGSGPAQAALAILADCMGDRVALHHYQEFKRHVIGRLPMDMAWDLSETQVRAWVAELEAKRPLPPEEPADLCGGCSKPFADCTCR